MREQHPHRCQPVEGWISQGPVCCLTSIGIDEGAFYGAISQRDPALLPLPGLQWSVLVRLGPQGEAPSEHQGKAAVLCRPRCWGRSRPETYSDDLSSTPPYIPALGHLELEGSWEMESSYPPQNTPGSLMRSDLCFPRGAKMLPATALGHHSVQVMGVPSEWDLLRMMSSVLCVVPRGEFQAKSERSLPMGTHLHLHTEQLPG